MKHIEYPYSFFDGIIRDVTLTKCYPQMQDSTTIIFDEKSLIQSLYISTMTLLGKRVNGYSNN